MSERPSTASGALGAAALGTDLLREAVVPTARDLHAAITRRLDRAPLRTANRLQGLVAEGAYAGVDRALSGVCAGLRAGDGAARRAGLGAALEAGPRGRFTVAALNGLFGDRIRADHPGLAVEMAPRVGSSDVGLTGRELAAAYPDAGEDVVVLLHGLGEDDASWRYGPGPSTYADHLHDERGWSPVVLRYNTGLPIAENGVALASLLDRLVVDWPVPVRRLALVGHSMGGLVVRSACAVLPGPGTTAWSQLVTDVVTLGTPHLGAPLAWGVSSGVSLLSLLPESAPFGRVLDGRSAGIFDLRAGLPPDVVNLPSARYRLVGASIGRRRTPLASVLGDGLVRLDSATGRPRCGAALFPGADVLHVRDAHHIELLNHPDVHTALDRWLGRGSGPVPGRRTHHEETR